MAGSLPPLNRLVPPYIQKIEAYIPSKPDDVLKKKCTTARSCTG